MTYYFRRMSPIILVVLWVSVGFSQENAETKARILSEKKGFCAAVGDDGQWLKRIEALHATMVLLLGCQ